MADPTSMTPYPKSVALIWKFVPLLALFSVLQANAGCFYNNLYVYYEDIFQLFVI